MPLELTTLWLFQFSSATLPRMVLSPRPTCRFRGRPAHNSTCAFTAPAAARKIALIAFDDSPERLRGLIPIAFKQKAEVVLVSNMTAYDLPEAVEVQPLQALKDIYQWADYAAFDATRENLPRLGKMLGVGNQPQAQVLVRAPMPCGAIAECGVCSIIIHREWKMICKDGPVFDLASIF